MTDSLVCMCAYVRHGIHAHSTIESIPDGIRFCWIVCILSGGGSTPADNSGAVYTHKRAPSPGPGERVSP